MSKNFPVPIMDLLGMRLILNNFSIIHELYLFSFLAWRGDSEVSGADFFIANSNYN